MDSGIRLLAKYLWNSPILKEFKMDIIRHVSGHGLCKKGKMELLAAEDD